jgi:hypothetical protein
MLQGVVGSGPPNTAHVDEMGKPDEVDANLEHKE